MEGEGGGRRGEGEGREWKGKEVEGEVRGKRRWKKKRKRKMDDLNYAHNNYLGALQQIMQSGLD